MKNIFNSYPLVLIGETIGAKETLSKEKRYEKLSHSFKVLSSEKTDEEIWEFYQWRKNSYRSIRLFTSFLLMFFIIMGYILTGHWVIALSIALPSLFFYGFIAVTVKPERKYAYLWDNKELFMEFLKLNRTDSFNPKNFDQYVEFNEDALVCQEFNFQEELRILKNETNKFNSVKMETVIHFFDILRENADYPEELKCVQISDKDIIRFIKARFVDNSDAKLDIELIKGNKSQIKALFYNFYLFSTTFYGESKSDKANSYMKLYLYSYKKFKTLDYTNFNDGLVQSALDYSKAIKCFNKMH